MLGLVHLALPQYERVLASRDDDIKEEENVRDPWLGALRACAAHNAALILYEAGSFELARQMLFRFNVVE